MSERYSKLFALPENLYAAGSPVVIAAGALLKDNQTGKVLAQLKLRSISGKRIKALTAVVFPQDIIGKPLGEAVTHLYLDLDAGRGDAFGQKVPIALADASTRSYRAEVTRVFFCDNQVWEGTQDTWEPLTGAVPIARKIADYELIKQYKLELGQDKTCTYSETKGLWYCACGALNTPEDSLCHVCHTKAVTLKALDWDALNAKKKQRLAAEKARADAEKAAEEERARIAREKAEEARKKFRKLARAAAPVAGLAAAAVIAIVLLVNQVFIPLGKYKDAVKRMESGEYTQAIAAFEAMGDYKDSLQRIEDCQLAILEEKYAAAVALLESKQYEDAIAAFEALDGYQDSASRIEEAQELRIAPEYEAAISLRDAGKYKAAIEKFEEIGKEEEAARTYYAWAEACEAEGDKVHAAMRFGAAGDYQDARQRSFRLWDGIAIRKTLSNSRLLTVGVKNDGTVVAAGNDDNGRREVEDWEDIIAVSVGQDHTVGLKSDGRVVAVGLNDDGQCEVSQWTDIVAVFASDTYTLGLKSDGTVVAAGLAEHGECDVSDWEDIVSVSARGGHTVGLRADGTVAVVGLNNSGQCNLSSWKNMKLVFADKGLTLGVREDGTLVTAGQRTGYNFQKIHGWKDVVSLSATDFQIAGLRSNGRAVNAEAMETLFDAVDTKVASSVARWSDLVAVEAGRTCVFGLKADGTVVVSDSSSTLMEDRKGVSEWTDIRLPNS